MQLPVRVIGCFGNEQNAHDDDQFAHHSSYCAHRRFSLVEQTVPIVERSNNARGIYPKVLAHFLTVLTGGERFAHMQWWQHGVEAIEKAFAVKWLPKAATTLTRFWNKIDSQSCAERLAEGARCFAKQLLSFEAIVEDNLNLDSTVLTR